jgi:lipopolysaccharide biosynthesis regulator YciM
VKLLAAAFQLDPSSAPAMCLLAQVCLMRGDHDKCRKLAEAAAAAADSTTLRASCHALAGRACHALGQVQDAARQYAQVGAAAQLAARLCLDGPQQQPLLC